MEKDTYIIYVTIIAGGQVFAKVNSDIDLIIPTESFSSAMPNGAQLKDGGMKKKIKVIIYLEKDHLQWRLQCIKRSVVKFQDHFIQYCLVSLPGDQELHHLPQSRANLTPSEKSLNIPSLYPFIPLYDNNNNRD